MTEALHSRRILRNVIYGFSTWILPLFLGFVVTRVVVRSLGHADYGIYALVLGFIAYSFNFNVGRAITKYIASYRATGETDKIRDVISATASVTIIVAGLGSVIIVALSRWLVVDVFDIEPEAQIKTITALRISAGTISVFMIGQVAIAVLQGLHRFDVFSKIQNANSLVMMLGNLFLAYNGYGLLALLYWNLAVIAVFCVISFISAGRLLPELSFVLNFKRETIFMVVKYSAGVVGCQIVGNAFFLFERSWIIAKLGAEALTFYVVPMTVGLYLHGFILSLSMSLFPLASEFGHESQRLLKLYRAATKSVMFVVVIVTTTLIAAGKLFLTLWMGPDFGEHSAALLTLQAIAFGMLAIVIISFQTAEGLGHPGFNLRNTIIGVVLALPLILWLTDSLGSLGVAYGRLTAFLIPFLAIVDFERRYLGGVQFDFWIGNLPRFALAGLGAYFIEWILLERLTENWLSLVLITIAGSAVYLIVLYLTGFITEDDRRLIRNLVQPAG
jgi:O-antigen/teichoic acid export membrane protein